MPSLQENGTVKKRRNKKADVVQPPKELHHVGLLVNTPPGTGRAAFYLVVRRF